MDYRHRKYYLTDWWCGSDWMVSMLKPYVKSLKMHAPYNHFKVPMQNKWERNAVNRHDVFPEAPSDFLGPTVMLSCLISEAEELEKWLRARKYTRFCEISKEVCGQ